MGVALGEGGVQPHLLEHLLFKDNPSRRFQDLVATVAHRAERWLGKQGFGVDQEDVPLGGWNRGDALYKAGIP